MAQTRRTRKAASPGWPKRGEIYLTALDSAVGHEIGKTWPALVIQNDTTNRYSTMTMVAPIASTVRLPISPIQLLLPANSDTGLAVSSVALFNQVRAVDHGRLIKKLGAVDSLVVAQMDEAIKAAFGLTSSPLGSDLDQAPFAVTDAASESIGNFKIGRYQR